MSAHLSHDMHRNSVAAYRIEESKLSTRAEAIMEWIRLHGPRTDRELAREMGFGENLNAVRPRLTELIDANRLMEVGDVKCPVTGKRVRRVDLRRARQEALF